MTYTKPVIVAGCGRSGTHWLGNIMEQVLGEGVGGFEPHRFGDISDVIVDSRLRHQIQKFKANNHRILHLARDGRDVVRSLRTWYGSKRFDACCQEWADAVDMMRGFPVLRLEDLTARGDPSYRHAIPHWREWDAELTDTFWRICRVQMERLGYGPEGR